MIFELHGEKSAWSILHGNTKLCGSLIAHNAHMINCFLKLRCKWVNDFLLNWGRLGSCLQKRGQQTISNFLTREWKNLIDCDMISSVFFSLLKHQDLIYIAHASCPKLCQNIKDPIFFENTESPITRRLRFYEEKLNPVFYHVINNWYTSRFSYKFNPNINDG